MRPRLFLIVAVFIVAAFVAAVPRAAVLDKSGLENSLRVVAPEKGLDRLEVREAHGGEVFAVIGHNGGRPLPAERSIVVSIDAGRDCPVLSSYVPQGLVGRYWTDPEWNDSLTKVSEETQYAIWKESSGKYGVMIPLVGGGMRAVMEGDKDSVLLVSQSFHEGFGPEAVPLFAIGYGDDPYELTRSVYTFAMTTMRETDPEGVIGRLRWEKEYPDIFKYIGWCSWNSHYRAISGKALYEHARGFKEAGFPMGFILIDDGWQEVSRPTNLPWVSGNLYMTGLGTDDKKFPNGLSPVVSKLKDEYNIKYVGVWHTFQGYWDGIARDSKLGREYKDALMPVNKKAAVPDPRSNAGQKFWNDWYSRLAGEGVDFVKVDNQSTYPSLVGDKLPISHAMAGAQRNLQAAAKKYFNSRVINCMEMNIDVVYQWETTNIARTSIDYVPIFYHNPRTHVTKNVMNSLWMSNLAYPDYDMWKTHDQNADYHSVARAISGGPVYITDNAGEERYELLWPLVLQDGKIIQVDEPALPVEKTMFEDPMRSGKPLLAFAPVNKGGVIAAWNVDSFERKVSASLAPSDVKGMEGDKFAVFDYFDNRLFVVERGDEFPVELGRWDVKLFTFVPIEEGFAAIGLADKYISSATVLDVDLKPGRALVELPEAGRFVAYMEKKPEAVKAGGQKVPASKWSFNNGMIEVSFTENPGKKNFALEIKW